MAKVIEIGIHYANRVAGEACLYPNKLSVVSDFGVDSGGFVLGDMDALAEYDADDEDLSIALRRLYRHKETGDLLEYGGIGGQVTEHSALVFGNYEQVVEKYGKTMNQMNEEGITEHVTNPIVHGFSYPAYCSQSTRRGSFLTTPSGKKVFTSRTSHGDGGYNIYERFINDDHILFLDVGGWLELMTRGELEKELAPVMADGVKPDQFIGTSSIEVAEVDPSVTLPLRHCGIVDPMFLPDVAAYGCIEPVDDVMRVFRVNSKNSPEYLSSLLWYMLIPVGVINKYETNA